MHHSLGLGLIVLDIAVPAGEVLAFQREGRAALVASEIVPASVADESVVLEVGDGCITLAKTAGGEPWAREFGLDKVSVAGVETLVVRPGKAVEPAPIWKAAAPVVARKVVAPAPELPITSRVVVLVTRGEAPAGLRAKWTDQEYVITHNPDSALPQPGELVGEWREIVVAGDGDQWPEDLESRVNKLG